MTLLIFIVAVISSVVAIAHLHFGTLIAIWVAAGLVLFVWQTLCDAGNAVAKAMPREQYNLTQNRYEFTESDDPTKPNENIPAIIEIGKHYRSKS